MKKKNFMGIRTKFTIFFLILGIVLTLGLSQMTYYVVEYQIVGQVNHDSENTAEKLMHKAASLLIRTSSSSFCQSRLDMLEEVANSIIYAENTLNQYAQLYEISQNLAIDSDTVAEVVEDTVSSAPVVWATGPSYEQYMSMQGGGESSDAVPVVEAAAGEEDASSVSDAEEEDVVGASSGQASAAAEDADETTYSDQEFYNSIDNSGDSYAKQLLNYYIGYELKATCSTYQLDSIYLIRTADLSSEEETALSNQEEPYYYCSVKMQEYETLVNGETVTEKKPCFDVLSYDWVDDFYEDEYAGLRNVIWNTKVRTTELDITLNEKGQEVATVYIPIAVDDQITAVIGADILMDDILADVREQVLPMAELIAISVLIMMLLLILFVNRVVIKPVSDLNAGISEMLDGKWNAQAKVHSNDELGVIAEMFNEMSQNISSHVKNIETLNASYSRLIPEKVIRLQNADSIINIHQGDHRTVSGMTIMSMQIDDLDQRSSQMSPDALFDFLNRVTSVSIPIVTSEETGHEQGIIERMENGGMEVFYQYSTEQALKDALQICKKSIEATGDDHVDLSIAITRGDILMGVVGQEERMDFAAFSEQKNLADRLIGIADSYYANVLISESAANEIPDFRSRYHSRLLCYVDIKAGVSESGETITRKEAIYDVYDSDPEEQKQLKQYTSEIYEQGVLEYAAGEYEQASRHFLEVLRRNVNDKGARQYI